MVGSNKFGQCDIQPTLNQNIKNVILGGWNTALHQDNDSIYIFGINDQGESYPTFSIDKDKDKDKDKTNQFRGFTNTSIMKVSLGYDHSGILKMNEVIMIGSNV